MSISIYLVQPVMRYFIFFICVVVRVPAVLPNLTSHNDQDTYGMVNRHLLRKPKGENEKYVALHRKYLSLMRNTLTGTALQTRAVTMDRNGEARTVGVDAHAGKAGGFCENCYTMVGTARLENVGDLLSRAISEEVPGDFVETGVWRGGTSMYARAVLDSLGEESREVFLCDSFEGLPKASTKADHSGWSKILRFF